MSIVMASIMHLCNVYTHLQHMSYHDAVCRVPAGQLDERAGLTVWSIHRYFLRGATDGGAPPWLRWGKGGHFFVAALLNLIVRAP